MTDFGSGSAHLPPLVSGCDACNRLITMRGCGGRHWIVEPYGFGAHAVAAPTRDAARYRSFQAAREAGYFAGRDGFHRFIASGVRVREAERGVRPTEATSAGVGR